MLLQCVNAEGQSRLVEGGIYDLIFDVQAGLRPGEQGIKSGYFVKVQDAEMAIPYVFRRSRFRAVTPEQQDGDDA